MSLDETEPWEGELMTAVVAFAEKCSDLSKSNPYNTPTLSFALAYLVGELRDYGLTPDEIRAGLRNAMKSEVLR